MTITISELQKRVGQINVTNGWRENDADYDEIGKNTALVARLGLICTEISEAIEDIRNGKSLSENHYTFPPVPASFAVEFSSGQDAIEAWQKDKTPKPEGVPSEIADVAIRILDTADSRNLTLSLDGPYGDVTSLDELRSNILAHEDADVIEDIDASNANEAVSTVTGIFIPMGRAIEEFDDEAILTESLSEALMFCVIVSLVFKFSLQEAIDEKLVYNSTRGHRHGGKLV